MRSYGKRRNRSDKSTAAFSRMCGGLLLPAILLGAGCGRGAAAPGGSVTEVASLTANAAVVPAAGPSLSPQPPAGDAQTVLQRMVKAYKSLDSAYIRSHADIVLAKDKASSLRQEVVTQFQKDPPRIRMQSADPVGGNHLYLADGRTVIHYSGVANQFMRHTGPASLDEMSVRIQKDTPQVLTPIVFLRAAAEPPGMKQADLLSPEAVRGKMTTVVRGEFSDAYLTSLSKRLFGVALKPQTRQFKLWLDPQTYLLRKAQVQVTWQRPGGGKGPDSAQGAILSFTETVDDLVQNPKLAETIFSFATPRGAKEIFIERGNQVE